jgi:cytochrome b6-f complex iron-sulfur subunit
VIGLSQSTFAVGVIALLLGLFVLLLLSSLIRARRAGREATGAPSTGRPGAAPAPSPTPVKLTVSRRDFFRGGLLASLLAFFAEFGGASIAFLWPNLKGGFGSVIQLPDPPQSILDDIHSTRQPFYFGAGRFYLIDYEGDGVESTYAGITAEVAGAGRLMAIYQKCAHLGCRVPFCQQSQWFECPCHGSKYNYAGEYELGPAPTGLSRFKVLVEGTLVKVDTSTIITGPPRGTNTINQSPEGPFCVGGAA